MFTVESDSVAMLGTYILKVIAKYTGSLYTKTDELPFVVTIEDPCTLATLTIDPTILNSIPISYKIGYEADVQTFTEDKVSSTEHDCPGYLFSVEDERGGVPDTSIFTFNPSLLTFTTFNTDL